MTTIITIRDLLQILKTDSIVIATNDGTILADAETPYISVACTGLYDKVIEKIVPLDNGIEITIRG